MTSKPKNKSLAPLSNGLINKGNTCFINSILQCLFHIDQIQSILNSPSLVSVYKRYNDVPLQPLKLFARLLNANYMNQASDSSLDAFVKKMQQLAYPPNTQQDANEYMLRLIDWLEEGIDYIRRDIVPQNHGAIRQNLDVQATTARTFLNNCFIGIQQFTICENCNNETISDLPKEILSLTEILEFDNLNDCIRNHFAVTQIPACSCAISRRTCNAFECIPCNKHVSARKYYTITNLPHILIIHLCIFDLRMVNNVFHVSV